MMTPEQNIKLVEQMQKRRKKSISAKQVHSIAEQMVKKGNNMETTAKNIEAKAGHTLGPLNKSYDSQATMLITLKGGEVVATVSNEYLTTTERNAYARLFAAAPELLEALESLRNQLVADGWAYINSERGDKIYAANAAIAKARN